MSDMNWKKAGIPINSMGSEIAGELVEQTGQSTGATMKEMQMFETGLGQGPQGNMMGSSVNPETNAAIDGAYNFAGPDAVVQTREKLEAIEAVEGFGQPDVGSKIVGGANGVTNEAD